MHVTQMFSRNEIDGYLKAMDFTPTGKSAGPTRSELMGTLYRSIDFTPPQEVADAALQALTWLKKGKKGGTPIGIGRAIQLSLRLPVPPRDIERMVAYFRRHKKDLLSPKAQKGEITPGVVAWNLWGGWPGNVWSNQINMEMKNASRYSY